MDVTAACEDALAAHWLQLGRLPGSEEHEHEGISWFETPVRHLPYNGVVRTRATDPAAIDVVLERLRGRGVEFWWVDHPSATPADLGQRLAAAGLRRVERMT